MPTKVSEFYIKFRSFAHLNKYYNLSRNYYGLNLLASLIY